MIVGGKLCSEVNSFPVVFTTKIEKRKYEKKVEARKHDPYSGRNSSPACTTLTISRTAIDKTKKNGTAVKQLLPQGSSQTRNLGVGVGWGAGGGAFALPS